MPLTKKRLAKELVRSFLDFCSLAPWDRYENEDVVALRLPGIEHPAMLVVMGAAGEEFGVILHLGERAPEHLAAKLRSFGQNDDLLDSEDILSVSQTPLRDIPPNYRGILDLAGFKGRREAPAPFFMKKRPGQLAAMPNRDDLEILLFAIRGFLHAEAKGLLTPKPLGNGEDVPLLDISGDARRPVVEVSSIVLSTEERLSMPPPALVPPGVREIPRTDTTWAVGFPIIPAEIRDDPRTVRSIVVFDEGTGLVLAAAGLTDLTTAADEFFAILKGSNVEDRPMVPSRVVFTSKALFDLLATALATLDVRCTLESSHPVLDEFIADLRRETDRRGLDSLPEPDDLEGWKKLDRDMNDRLLDLIDRNLVNTKRPLERFFGSDRTGQKIMTSRNSEEESAIVAFVCWLLLHYRESPRSPTPAEDLLGRTVLSPAERALLLSRIRGRLSIYRVAGRGDKGRVTLTDILDGSQHEIRDFSMAESDTIDLCIPANLYAAGDFLFPELRGPSLTPENVLEALDFLEELVSPLTRANLERTPHALGRLWRRPGWDRPSIRTMPIMKNADGDALELIEATFDIRDPEVFQAAIKTRGDLIFDSPDSLSWVRDLDGDDQFPGDGVILAGLRLEGLAAIANVNSRERLRKLAEWMEKIPGVSLRGKRTIPTGLPGVGDEGGDIDADHENDKDAASRTVLVDSFIQPTDGTENPEELMRRRFHEQSLGWLDQAHPLLDGKTPREACDTESGRRRVRRMILTMPRSGGGASSFEPPREEMLRELDLTS